MSKPVRVQFCGTTVTMARLPAVYHALNWTTYALADRSFGYLVIAQIDGAPEWRGLNASLSTVRIIGRRLLRLNAVTGPLFTWPRCPLTPIGAPQFPLFPDRLLAPTAITLVRNGREKR